MGTKTADNLHGVAQQCLDWFEGKPGAPTSSELKEAIRAELEKEASKAATPGEMLVWGSFLGAHDATEPAAAPEPEPAEAKEPTPAEWSELTGLDLRRWVVRGQMTISLHTVVWADSASEALIEAECQPLPSIQEQGVSDPNPEKTWLTSGELDGSLDDLVATQEDADKE